MSLSDALALAGYDQPLRLASGEILDAMSGRRFKRTSVDEAGNRRVEPMSLDALALLHEELATGRASDLTPELRMDADQLIELLGQAQAKLVADSVLREIEHDGQAALTFAIDPHFSYGTGEGRAASVARQRAAAQITTIPRGTVFTSTGKPAHGQLQRAVNVQIHTVMGWSISRYRGRGDKVDWRPPALSYAGTGGYWRDAYAIGPLGHLMAQAIDQVDAQLPA